MKLSEAIRLGAMLKPQTDEGELFHDGATCALGAALDACGRLTGDVSENYATIEENWPFTEHVGSHPINGAVEQIYRIIEMLNDDDGWTRERIADWVATVEPPEETAPFTVVEDADLAWAGRPVE